MPLLWFALESYFTVLQVGERSEEVHWRNCPIPMRRGIEEVYARWSLC